MVLGTADGGPSQDAEEHVPYRRSRQRERILELLQSTEAHPTAGWLHGKLWKEFPNLSLGTVYRNIGVLIEQGLISRIAFGSTFDRLDANGKPHYHFICEKCDSIIDLDIPIDESLNAWLEKSLGFNRAFRSADTDLGDRVAKAVKALRQKG